MFPGETASLTDAEKAMDTNTRSADIYDMPLRLLGAYHIIEWFRMTLFLTTLLLGSNFLPIWYGTSLNTLFNFTANYSI